MSELGKLLLDAIYSINKEGIIIVRENGKPVEKRVSLDDLKRENRKKMGKYKGNNLNANSQK